jgi:hypothetical protein
MYNMQKDKFIHSFNQKGRNHLQDQHIHNMITQRLIITFYHLGIEDGNAIDSMVDNQISNKK